MDDETKTKRADESESPSAVNGSIPLVKVDEEHDSDKQLANGTNQQKNDGDDNESYTPSMDERNDELPEMYDNFNSSLTLNELHGDVHMDCINDHLPVPPDGGYGWVIVFAAFVSNFFVDGVANSFGAFIKSYENEFKASTAVTSLIGSLLIGVYLLAGPVAGGLVNNFGARPVVVCGSILTAVAFFLATYAKNIFVFMILYGVLGGIGFGFVYLPAIVVVGYYFESKRALATGLAVAGSGFGTFVMPIVCVYCIEHIGWQYTLWVISGLILLCALCGLLYKPLEFPEIDLEDQKRKEEQEPLKLVMNKLHQYDESHTNGGPLPQISEEDGVMKPPTTLAVSRTNSVSTNVDRDDVHHGMDSEVFARLRSALSECENDSSPPTPIRPPLSPITENRAITKSRAGSTYNHGERHIAQQRNRKLTLTSMGSEMTSNQDLKMSRHNLTSQLSRISARSYAQSLSRLSQNPQSLKAGDSVLSVALSGVDPKEFMRPLNRRDIFYQGSIRNLKEFGEEGNNYRSYRESQISIPAAVVAQSVSHLSHGGDMTDFGSRMSRITGGLIAEELEELDFVDDSKCKCIPYVIRNAFSEMIDLELLKEPVMLLLTISNILGMLGFYVPFMFVISMATEKGLSKSDAALLLSIIGITNTFGRVIFGWVADRGWMSALTINNLSLISCGILTCLCPFLPGFAGLCGYAILFGFIISAYICLTSIVLSDLLGLERLTNSFGLLVVGRGIASLLGTPIAGIVYDVMQSYDSSFVFAGVLIVLSGLVSCAIPFVHRHQRNQMKNEGCEDNGDAQSGKLSVLTEHSEENLTEYQRTIQSLRQQHQLLQDYEEERKKQLKDRVSKVSEEDETTQPEAHSPEASPMHPPTAPLITNAN
ncbi:hypothetical protein QR680_002162 [Steinernema hermaphroditum]|uniref:Major facilitator superfamily (MFS) profile domain-containing protein n=1 Tax=Steinernema hermaphroditum TaxID=289476 RepID=A0AA39H1K2_9BILA|nr:hypothetical protein QR680_002162 [Steinernema hermaphroditum]